MPPYGAKAACLYLSALLLLGHCVTSLIVPEEVPTILSLIYSNIPPVKKGTDSRLGVGFRLGEHADFQIILELGPQKETDPLGNDVDSKRKRAAIMTAAMRGELGPWAQSVAKYQVEQKLRKMLEKYKLNLQKTSEENLVSTNQNTNKSAGSDWLLKWSKDQAAEPDDPPLPVHTTLPKASLNVNRMRVVNGAGNVVERNDNEAQRDLNVLKQLFGNGTDEAEN